MTEHSRSTRLASLALRAALAAAFLSAVADRFGLWGPPGTPGVGWGDFPSFLDYTATLLPFLPAGLIPVTCWTATILEVVLAVGLLVGVRLRLFAWASGLLLCVFAVTMTISLGPEPPLSYSVWTAAAAAILLATMGHSRRAIDDVSEAIVVDRAGHGPEAQSRGQTE